MILQVVPTHSRNISQNGSFPPKIGVKIMIFFQPPPMYSDWFRGKSWLVQRKTISNQEENGSNTGSLHHVAVCLRGGLWKTRTAGTCPKPSITLPETNQNAPENGPSQKETIVFQPSISRGEPLGSGSVAVYEGSPFIFVFWGIWGMLQGWMNYIAIKRQTWKNGPRGNVENFNHVKPFSTKRNNLKGGMRTIRD